MKKAKTVSIKYLLFDFIRITALPALIWFRPKKLYINEAAKKKIHGGALMISNHIGLFDPMYLMLGLWYRRHHFVATTELFDGKIKRKLFERAFLCIEIDRQNFGMSTFRQITDHLAAGELVTMFPEGRINEEKQGVQAFKSGMALMALKSGAPLVPVYIKRRKHFYSRLVLAIGEPVEIKNFASGETATLADINRATQYLHEQEEILEKMCEG